MVTGLLGPSGSGKTTLMRAIVGVQIVERDGHRARPAGGLAGAARRVGYVTQAPSVYGDLTVRENLRYFARSSASPPARVARGDRDRRARGPGDQVVGALSGGERARVSLATALLGEPELLVLDEPTVGLDPVLRRDLWATFHELAADGATLLVSSHVMDEAERCDQLLLMREGARAPTTTPDALLEQTGAQRPRAGVPRADRGGVTPASPARPPPACCPAPPRPAHDRARCSWCPVLLVMLLRTSSPAARASSSAIGGPLLGLFPFISMFLVTSIAMLRERTTGTLERLMTLPLAKLDLLAGYALAFGADRGRPGGGRLARSASALLGLDSPAPRWLVIVLAVANALLGTALGLFVSAFARPSSRRCSSCRRSCSRRSCSAACFVAARPDGAGCCEASRRGCR